MSGYAQGSAKAARSGAKAAATPASATAPTSAGRGVPRYVGATSAHQERHEQEARGVADRVAGGQRAPTIGAAMPAATTAPVAEPGGGSELSPQLRARFEPRFGQSLADVRVHTGADAARAAQEQQARAFTVGRHVIFGENAWAPDTSSGEHLLAHELAHTVQQSRGAPSLMRDALAALPEATRQEIQYDTDKVAIDPKSHFGLAGEPDLASNVDENFDLQIKGLDKLTPEQKTDRERGLKSYARALFGLIPAKDTDPVSNPRLNLTQVRDVDLPASAGALSTAFRFTCHGSQSGGKIHANLIVEQLDARQAPMGAAAGNKTVAAEKAAPYGIRQGAGISADVWSKILRSLDRIPESLIMRIRNVTFVGSGAQTSASAEPARYDANYDPKKSSWKQTITIYDELKKSDESTFAFFIAHEIGHAIDMAPALDKKTGYVAGNEVHADAGFVAEAAKDGVTAVTAYGGTDSQEAFAEALAMYVQQPATLKALRPNTYAWFEQYAAAALTDPALNPKLPKPKPKPTP